jgi:signal recognition particle subunit SRP54
MGMFGSLTEKFKGLFAGISSKKTLTEGNIADAVSQVRLALLDADVNYEVASNFVTRVKEKALGEAVLKAVSPGEQFIKVVHDELVRLMGSEETPVEFKGPLTTLLMCGLQGSGKTTQCAKLAAFFSKKDYGKKTLIAACDLQRPAAVEQLKRLCEPIGVAVFFIEGEKDPVKVAKSALAKAKDEQFDLLIIDTAGRLHLDEELMEQLEKIKAAVDPQEVLFVASSATGQDAVKTAAEFDKRVAITGTILTMLDGNARAGAAISIREVTQKPLKFEGVGEKLDDLQLFNPRSMADRILGMGDVINLVKKAKEQFDEKETKKIEEKLKKASFTYEDFLSQMNMIKKMGPLKGLLQMIPGASNIPNLDQSESEMKKIEAMILSMTLKERRGEVELDSQRGWRVAKGSGTQIKDVNGLIKKFKHMKDFMKDKQQLKKLEKTWL